MVIQVKLQQNFKQTQSLCSAFLGKTLLRLIKRTQLYSQSRNQSESIKRENHIYDGGGGGGRQ